jgi:hypothetical protein
MRRQKREGDELTRGGDPAQRLVYLEGEVTRLTNELRLAETAQSAAGAATATLTAQNSTLQTARNTAVGMMQAANTATASAAAELVAERSAPPTAKLAVLVANHADAVVDALAPALAAGIRADLAQDRDDA